MAKHRDLAQIVYANTLGRESASRIWRAVVVAGAMLGAPLIATAETAPPAPPAQASRPAPPPPTKAELAKQAAEVVKALAAEMAALDKTIAAATTDVSNAQNQADRDLATAKLRDLRKQKTNLGDKQRVAKAEQKRADAEAKAEAKATKPKPRPRTPEEVRPRGRGFILS